MTDSKLEANGRQLGEMSIIDHLEALRWTLVRVFTALGVFIIGGFAFVPWIFKHVVMAPIDNGFFLYPKSVIRISLCRTAKRNPLIFPI